MSSRGDDQPQSFSKRTFKQSKSWLAMVAVSSEATEKALHYIRAMHAAYPRMDVTLLDIADGPWAYSRPMPSRWAIPGFLKCSNPGLIIFGGLPQPEHERLRRAAVRHGCALAAIAPLPSAPNAAELQRLIRHYQLDHLFTYGTASDRPPIAGWTDLDRADYSGFVRALTPLAPRLTRNVEFQQRAPRLFNVLGERVAELKFPRITSLEHLRELLDKPATLMCLGNGPSCETPELKGLKFDRLFRVNHSWKDRGWFTEPDLVFTHLIKSIRSLRPRVGFVVRQSIDERFMRWRFRWLPRHIRLATGEGLKIDPPTGFESLHQTHGAMMLAAAVALQPKRLIVAGIDLFSDAAGAYPGDAATPNEYALGHDRVLETRYIVGLLRAYQGELIVFGDALKRALARDADGV